jgi:hypothetical protein
MTESLRALLTGLIDYAGMFPPAKLPLPEALANHVRYRASADAWMLGRFICPAARLGELTAVEDLFRDGPALVISALGRGGVSREEFLTGLRDDLEDIGACRQRHAGRVVIDVLETRLATDSPAARAVLDGIAELTRLAGMMLFFEIPMPWDTEFQDLVYGIADTSLAHPVGFKMRTGGLEAGRFPSCKQVAFALSTCLNEELPFKATAGLHHPFSCFRPENGAGMYGFINLFTAGALLHADKIPYERVWALLEDNEPAHFRFTDAGLDWEGLTTSTEEIVRARQKMVSFGSCSFDEPRDDLRALGWL